jgi:hypothetical protein
MLFYGRPRHCYPDNNHRPQSRHTGSNQRHNTKALRRLYKKQARAAAKSEVELELEESEEIQDAL